MSSPTEVFYAAFRAGAPLLTVDALESRRAADVLSQHLYYSPDPNTRVPGGLFRAVFGWYSLGTGLSPLVPSSWTLTQHHQEAYVNFFQESFGDKPTPAPRLLFNQLDRVTQYKKVLFVHDVAAFISKPEFVSLLFDYTGEFGAFKTNNTMIVLIGDTSTVPEVLSCNAIHIRFGLPSDSERRSAIMDSIADVEADLETPNPTVPESERISFTRPEEHEINELVSASQGLTTFEIEQSAALDVVLNSRLKASSLRDMIRRKMYRFRALQLIENNVRFEDVAGFDDAKTFLYEAAQPCDNPDLRFKGALLLSFPGTGKSFFSSALANELGVPHIEFNISSMLNSLVGASERMTDEVLEFLDSNNDCVIRIDEIEKVLGTGSGERDGGVMTRVLGKILTWMNDRTSSAILIATCNNADRLPPELTRAGRFDIIYFADIPNEAQMIELCEIYSNKFEVDMSGLAEKAAGGWTGAEVALAGKYMARHGFSVDEVFKRITTIENRMGPEKVKALRQFAAQEAIDVATGEPYRPPTGKATKTAKSGRPRRNTM